MFPDGFFAVRFFAVGYFPGSGSGSGMPDTGGSGGALTVVTASALGDSMVCGGGKA